MRMSIIKGSIVEKIKYHMEAMKIHLWLREQDIFKFKINSDLSVDVFESVNLYGKRFKELPVNFREIHGNFNCGHNDLTTLKGCPKIVKGTFDCSENLLTSLEFCPETVGLSFLCTHNQLTSLDHSPKTIGADFDCSNNKLESLSYSPTNIKGSFHCNFNQITTLKGGPQYCGNDYHCQSTLLETLDFCPIYVGGVFSCYNTKLKNLEGFTTQVQGQFQMSGYSCPLAKNYYRSYGKDDVLLLRGDDLKFFQEKWNLRLKLEAELPNKNITVTKRPKI